MARRKYQRHKLAAPPVQFRAGFLGEMDQRSELAKALRANFDAIVGDAGGADDVSHVKASVIERFVWLEAVLRSIEYDMAHGKIDKDKGLARWIQGLNALSGLARAIGTERKHRAAPWLAALSPPGNGNGAVVEPAVVTNGDGAGGTDK